MVGRCHEEICHDVILLKGRSLNTTTTTFLGSVKRSLSALDVAIGRKCYDDWFYGNQVFVSYVVFVSNNCCTSFITKLIYDVGKLFTYYAALASQVRQYIFVVCNLRHQFVVLGLQLVAFKRGKFTKLHIKNRLRLNFINVKKFHQASLRN